MSEKLKRAVETAKYAHEGQKRKGTDIDYVTHPLEVEKIVEGCGASEDACIAALFHDILEDVPAERYSEQRMREEYGDRVVEIVKGLSEPKQAGGPRKPWKERKDAYLQHLATTDDEDVLVVCAGDKIANLESMLADYEKVGEELWERFNAGKEQQRWYYEQILRILAEKLSGQDRATDELVTRLRNAVAKLRSIVPYHVVICVLSALRSGKLPVLDSYTIAGNVVSEGRQTNEAPVRFLLDHAKGSITEVLCLCSKDCTESRTFDLDEDEAIKLSDQGFLLDGEDSQENQAKGYSLTESSLTITTERYFKESLRAFCESKKIKNPIFTPIAYEPGNPERSIGEIVRHIRSNTTIDIDTTGGPRDAVLLLSLAANVIFAQSDDRTLEPNAAALNSLGSHVAFGSAVYSDFFKKLIRSQDAAFGLFKLVSAVQAFTRYGKADLLSAYFAVRGAGKSRMHRQIVSLCENMEKFSADLSLCKVNDIQGLIENIHAGFDEEEKSREEDAKNDTGELLLRSLIPSIRDRFVPSQSMLGGMATPKAKALQHVAIIRWCVERQMIQQALAIYVEGTPECFFNAGFFKYSQGERVDRGFSSRVVKQLSVDPSKVKKGCLIDFDLLEKCIDKLDKKGSDEMGFWKKPINENDSEEKKEESRKFNNEMKLALRVCFPSRFLKATDVSVTSRGAAYLPLNLAMYAFVNNVRNAVMHGIDPKEIASYRFKHFMDVANVADRFNLLSLETTISMEYISNLLNTAADILELTIKTMDNPNSPANDPGEARRCAFDVAADEILQERAAVIEAVDLANARNLIRKKLAEFGKQNPDYVFIQWEDLFPSKDIPYVTNKGRKMAANQIAYECCNGARADKFNFRTTPVIELKENELLDDDREDEALLRLMKSIETGSCKRAGEDGRVYVAFDLIESKPTKSDFGLSKTQSLIDGLCAKYPKYFARTENNGFYSL